eukprot:COSAG03_NODE_798_length_5810_cov_4.253371_5_plen_147_part_00
MADAKQSVHLSLSFVPPRPKPRQVLNPTRNIMYSCLSHGLRLIPGMLRLCRLLAACFVGGRGLHRTGCLIAAAPTDSRPCFRCGSHTDERQHARPDHTVDLAKEIPDRIVAGLDGSLPPAQAQALSGSSTALFAVAGSLPDDGLLT